jgi:geranyl-CoA carboxylase alpha subunit
MKNFDSVLVANRGEIAVRVLRSAREQGYRTIAVYSSADAFAPHVQMADAAVLIGDAPVKESYLDPAKILAAAHKTGAQAIHPGYGFLSENAEFASACAAAGIVFIGPSAQAIELMGNKAASKRRMLEAGVPCVPGYQGEDQSDKILLAAAAEIGAPIMVKAAAGGGGRGMRLVHALEQLPEAIASARSEAENAFGSGELILEKAVLRPRHVEIQVFGDDHGNVIHLGERDCSVQRRHQKVVEESPCPVMTPALREAMGQAAVDAASSIAYQGAGTVEFLLDSDGAFYFLEMNTRLQVEHPVTEMVTGQDLVAMQLHVAQGYPLPLTQKDVVLHGHAIEVRLYAEDTTADFLPATGLAQVWLPPEGEGIRVDHGLLPGQEISPFYDPMIAKIIAWGDDRSIARRRLLRALQNTVLFGLSTNRQFLIDVLQRDAFTSGEATTAFIDENFSSAELQASAASEQQIVVAACLAYRMALEKAAQASVSVLNDANGWSGTRELQSHFRFAAGEAPAVDCFVRATAPDQYRVMLNDKAHQLGVLEQSGAHLRVALDDVQCTVYYAVTGAGEIALQIDGRASVLSNTLALTAGDRVELGSGTVTAPMHGNMLEILVAVGDRVEPGQGLAVMEAMKMEHRLKASVAGEVVAVHAAVGNQVSAGSIVLEIAADPSG